MWLGNKFQAFILIVTSISTAVSCSGVKFAGSSGKSSGGATEQPTEQPTDVAGGFGLTCTQADNLSDPLSMDYSCTFVTNIGQKFQETADQKVELTVQSGGKDVTFVNQDPTSSSSFKFTVLKSEISSVKIAAKVTNPLEGNKIKGGINKALSDVIDTTPPFAPNVTGTSTPTANTTPTWSWSSGGNGGNGMYRYRLNDSTLASGAIEIAGTSFTPGAALSEGTHTLYVQERDAAGNWSASGSFAIQVVTPPAAPTLTPPTRLLNSLRLSWAPVTGVTYNLYWSNSAGVTTASSKIANVVSVYNHTSLSGGTTYYYKLAAVKSGVESALSNEVSAAPYSNVAPTVTGISPSTGPTRGGTPVTITGTGFVSGATVAIGGTNAASVIFGSPTSLTATTPVGTEGTQTLVVKNPDGQNSTELVSFNYTDVTACTGDCYLEGSSPNFAQDLLVDTTKRQGPNGTTLVLEYANGISGFKIWKELNGTRILNASGKPSNGWQKQLSSDGKTKISADFTAKALILGRTCPANVYVDDNNKTATGKCLYYSTINETAAFLDGTGLEPWCSTQLLQMGGNDYTGKWFWNNIGACQGMNMRLPTVYETKTSMRLPFDQYPQRDILNGASQPTFDPLNGVPVTNSGIWTATTIVKPRRNPPMASDCSNDYILVSTTQQFWNYCNHYDVRCVLPE